MTRRARQTLTRALTVLLLCSPLATRARADEPPCIAECREMAAKGELKKNLNEQGCQVTVCQEEGRLRYKEANYTAALASLAVVQDRLAASPSFLLDRGLVYYGLGRFQDALKDFDGILAEVPDSFQAGAERAHTLMRLARLAEARAQFAKLLDSPAAQREFRGLRTKSYLQGNIGVIDVIDKDYAKGKKELEDALAGDGRNSLAVTFTYRVLPQVEKKTIDGEGILLLQGASEDVGLNRKDAARDAIETLVKKYPKFPETYFLGGELYRNTGHYEECERLFKIGENALPDDVDIKAERMRCTLLRVGPTSPAAHDTISDLKQLAWDHPNEPLPKEILRALDIY